MSAITFADIDAFLESKGKQGWTRASLAALASSLRSFFRFAEARGWCAPGITAVIEAPRIYAREGIPEGPGWDDVKRLLVATGGDRPADIRDHAILMLLAVYGLRRGEVAELRLDDLDWEGELIHIARPKQRRAQRYPLLPVVGEAILRYLREVRPRCGHRALFLTLGAPIRPLSAPSITPIAHAHLSRLGLTLSPRGAHCLRHYAEFRTMPTKAACGAGSTLPPTLSAPNGIFGRHSLEGPDLQSFEEGQQLIVWVVAAGVATGRCGLGQSLLFHGQVGVEIDLRCFDRFMTEQQSDH